MPAKTALWPSSFSMECFTTVPSSIGPLEAVAPALASHALWLAWQCEKKNLVGFNMDKREFPICHCIYKYIQNLEIQSTFNQMRI